MNKITTQTIADIAGVSRGTVDRVLHGRPHVRKESRLKVEEALRSTGYGEWGVSKSKRKRVGILIPGSRWFNDDMKEKWLLGVAAAEGIVEPLGISVILRECETDYPYDIKRHIDEIAKDGLDGLIFSAQDNPVVEEMVDDLVAKGVYVVTLTSDIPDSGRSCFVGSDPHKGGRLAAALICKYLKGGDKILIVAGNLEINAHKQRVQGFIEKAKEMGIPESATKVEQSFNDYLLTYEKVSIALNESAEIRAIYMANESVAACAEAIKRSGRTKIMVVGNDLSKTTRALLRDGSVDFILEQDMYSQVYYAVLVMKQLLLEGGRDVKKTYDTKMQILTAENVDSKG